MKYILNELNVKTTNSFKINNLEIDLDITSLNTNKLYSVEGIEVKQKIKEDILSSKVGLDFPKYLELTITVTKKYDNPVLINYDFNNNDSLISKIIINYGKDSTCDFIINYKSFDNNKHFNYLVEEINMEEFSNGNITYINNLNDISTNIMSFNDKVLNNSSITHNLIDIGGNIKIYNAYLESMENSKNYFNNIYIGKDENIIDINYDLKNIGKNSINDLKVEGLLKDKALKNFRGTIDFIEGSTKAIGKEYENCVLLSDEAISRSLPMLLCHEEDVVGAHGESTGKINEDKLFYLMSRGLSRKEAEKLIIISNFNSIINLINNDSIKEEVLEKIESMI